MKDGYLCFHFTGGYMTQQNAARMQGFIRAIADQKHPLQTRLSLIITDFEPNRNKQGIPKAEAENILRTALNTPLKINFDGVDFYGHQGAIPVGPIISAYADIDNGRDVIAGEAIIWNDVYGEVAEHLKVAFAEGVGTSWEIYFEDSENDDNGIQWLKNCVFAGTCVVDTPAYGPNRTRLLAIAEELNNRAEQNTEKINMAQTVATDTSAKEASVDTTAVADTTSDVTSLRTDLSAVMDTLSNMYSGLWQMMDETDMLEQELATTDMPSMADQLTKLVASIQKRFDALKEKAAKAETAEAELTTLKDSIAQAELEKAKAEKQETRKNALAEVGIELTPEKVEFYLAMTDELFTQYVEDLKAVAGNKKVVAEVRKTPIPEPTNTNATTTITIQELAAVIRGNR